MLNSTISVSLEDRVRLNIQNLTKPLTLQRLPSALVYIALYEARKKTNFINRFEHIAITSDLSPATSMGYQHGLARNKGFIAGISAS